MDDQRTRIAHIREMGEHIQRIDKSDACLAPAAQIKTEDCTATFGQQFRRELPVRVTLEFGITHGRDGRFPRQELHHTTRVVDMPRHAQSECFDALQDMERRGRRHAGPEVTHAFLPRADDESRRPELLAEYQPVKSCIGLGERGKFAGGLPVEAATVHQKTADHDAVPAQEFGGGMHHQIGTELQRFHQPRRGEGGIDQQRQPGLMGDGGDRGNVQHLQVRVAQRFAKNQSGLGANGSAEGLGIAGIHKGSRDAEAWQRIAEQIV